MTKFFMCTISKFAVFETSLARNS